MSLLLRLLVPLARSRCSTSPVLQAPGDRVERHAGADHAPADDEHVELRRRSSPRVHGCELPGSAH